MVLTALAGLFIGRLCFPESRLPRQYLLQQEQRETERQGGETNEIILNQAVMRRLCCLLLLMGGLVMTGCRTQKTGCKVPKRNMGAERVMDEMNQPKKRGLFNRN